MLRLLLCLRKKPDVDETAFQRWLSTEYLAHLAAEADTLKLARFSVLTHQASNAATTIRSRRGTAEPYDAVVEMWWQSRRDMYTAGLTPEGIASDARVIAAESDFVDHSHSVAMVTDDEDLGSVPGIG